MLENDTLAATKRIFVVSNDLAQDNQQQGKIDQYRKDRKDRYESQEARRSRH